MEFWRNHTRGFELPFNEGTVDNHLGVGFGQLELFPGHSQSLVVKTCKKKADKKSLISYSSRVTVRKQSLRDETTSDLGPGGRV
jgi:hypothetical protein